MGLDMRARFFRWARTILAGARHYQLERLDMPSGLGGSAWALYGLVRALRPRVCVEIGSAHGRSACFIGAALRDNGFGKLYAIDPHSRTAWNDDGATDTYAALRRNLRRVGVRRYVEIVRATSEAAARQWSRPIDLLFIDGDHSYAGVRRDWEAFAPFVQPFGVTIFHDTLWDLRPDPALRRADMGVPQFVEELREQGYPVIALERDFGVSVVQPVRHGIALQGMAER
jgi:predicted O-methyltransferase YrrM